MEGDKVHYRHILLYLFRKGETAAAACREICSVYGVDAVTERTCQIWFKRFRSGDFDLQDKPRSGRPSSDIDDQMKVLISNEPKATTQELAESLNVPKSTVHDHLQRLGFVSRLNVWVPHELTERNLITRISICEILKKQQERDPFLKRIVTGDEKWVVYNNVLRKRSWSQKGQPPSTSAKAELHPKKVMLSVWWNWKGVVHHELLPAGRTINSDVYCSQLSRLNQSIQEKCPALANRKGVVFQHDNAKPHTSLVTRNKLQLLGWEVLPHPPYSPDLAPSDYHLFRSLQNSLNGKSFETEVDVKKHLDGFFTSKSQDFYARGILQLPERWQEVIDKNGQYIVD